MTSIFTETLKQSLILCMGMNVMSKLGTKNNYIVDHQIPLLKSLYCT